MKTDAPGTALAGEERGKAAANGNVAFGPLPGLVGFLVAIAQLRLYSSFFSEFESEGLTPGEISILTGIAFNPGVRQGVLADALLIKWSNMAKIVRSLINQGLIERRVSPADRRAVELHLTADGRGVVDQVLPALERNDRDAVGMLDDDEHRELLRLLGKIADIGKE